MSDREIDPELLKRVEEIKKKMKESGRDYSGEDSEDLGGGPYFGPGNDIEYRKLIKEIRESGKDEK